MRRYIITATLCITILLAIALFRGIDGLLLASGISAIVGLGGYFLGRSQKPPRHG